MFATLIYSGCKKAENLETITSKLNAPNPIIGLGKKNTEADVMKDQTVSNFNEVNTKKRVQTFNKLTMDVRTKISESLMFRNGRLCGVGGNLAVFKSLSKNDLKELYQTIFNGETFVVYDENDKIVVSSFENTSETRIGANNSADWDDTSCWKSYWGKKNTGHSDEPCIVKPTYQCMVCTCCN